MTNNRKLIQTIGSKAAEEIIDNTVQSKGLCISYLNILYGLIIICEIN